MIDGSTMWWGLRVDKVFSGNRQRHDTVPLHCLERTHHEPSIVEIISMESIREAAGLKDGSRIAIAVQVSR